jgi:hypothetical protein
MSYFGGIPLPINTLGRGGGSGEKKAGKITLVGLRRFRSAKKAQTITGQRVNLDL